MFARLFGGRLGSARRPDPAPDSPQSEGEEQLMSRGGTFRQTAIADATPFSSYNPDNNGILGLPGSWSRPMGRGRELTTVPGSAANSLPSASLPPAKPSSEARAAVGTRRFTFEEEGDVAEQMSASPMDEARPSQVDETAEAVEPVVAAASWQPAPTKAAGAAASAAAAAVLPADEEEQPPQQQPEQQQQQQQQQQQPRGASGGGEGVPDDDSGVDQPPALGKRRRKRKRPVREQQQYAKLKYTPPSEGERHGAWEGQTVDGDVHDVYRGGFKAKEQQRCLNQPNKWVTLMPGDAREPADSAGVAADEGFLPAADRELAQRGVNVRPAARRRGFRAREYHSELGCARWITRRHTAHLCLSPPV